MDAAPVVEGLPPWRSVLAVVAHPDDESFGLGAVIDEFVRVRCGGRRCSASPAVRRPRSTGSTARLSEVRAAELADAAQVLGISSVRLLSYPDGSLAEIPVDELVDRILEAVDRTQAEGLLVFDPSGVTGHPDHVHATTVAARAAERRGLGVLAWTLPNPVPSQLESEFGAALHRSRSRAGRRRAPGESRASARGRHPAPEPGRPGQRALAPARAARRPGAPALGPQPGPCRSGPELTDACAGRTRRAAPAACRHIPPGVSWASQQPPTRRTARCADR